MPVVSPVQHIGRFADPDFRVAEMAGRGPGKRPEGSANLLREETDVAVIRAENQPFLVDGDKINGGRQRGGDTQR